jgi:hypothetical protein
MERRRGRTRPQTARPVSVAKSTGAGIYIRLRQTPSPGPPDYRLPEATDRALGAGHLAAPRSYEKSNVPSASVMSLTAFTSSALVAFSGDSTGSDDSA